MSTGQCGEPRREQQTLCWDTEWPASLRKWICVGSDALIMLPPARADVYPVVVDAGGLQLQGAKIKEPLLTDLWVAVDDTTGDTGGCSGCMRRESCRLAQGESKLRILNPWKWTVSGAEAGAETGIATARPWRWLEVSR